jgi:4-carboxymuconolactone decarboxylase
MDTKETGRQIMRELMGAGYVEGKDKKRNHFNAVLHEYSEEVCFGRTWSRKGIDRKLRSILNVAMLTALNRPAQLRNHVEGALNNGCTVDELREILLHTAVYCGLPAADGCLPGRRGSAAGPQARGVSCRDAEHPKVPSPACGRGRPRVRLFVEIVRETSMPGPEKAHGPVHTCFLH